jgi:16S rRNA (cytosine967-C5)-methyltransferase
VFLDRHREFAVVPPAEVATAASLAALVSHATGDGLGIQMTPRRTGTDGFFVSILRREA